MCLAGLKFQPPLDDFEMFRVAYQLGLSVLNASAKLHHARLDEAESATMCQIITLRIASRLFPSNQRLQTEMNQLFENLRVHYSENFDDFATRLGNLILLTNEIEVGRFEVKLASPCSEYPSWKLLAFEDLMLFNASIVEEL